MSVRRVFLGWEAPLLVTAVDWLLASTADGSRRPELERTLVVVPGRRAGRRLLEALVLQAGRRGHEALTPPTVITPGALIETLHPPVDRVATPLRSRLALVRALQGAPRERLERLTPRRPDTAGWSFLLELAGALEGFEEELEREALTVAAARRRCAERLEFPEEERWRAIEQVLAERDRLLLAQGQLSRHRARRRMLERAASGPRQDAAADSAAAAGFERIVLIGVVELGRLFRRALVGHEERTVCLIAAPEAEAEAFDELGVPRSDLWSGRAPELELARVRVVERPGDLVREAVHQVDRWVEAGVDTSWMSIGVGDPARLRGLQDALDLAGHPSHAAAGRPLTVTRPARLLDGLARYLDGRRLGDLAAWVRQPDAEALLGAFDVAELAAIEERPGELVDAARRGDWATVLDRYSAETLAETLHPPLPGSEAARAVVAELDARVARLVGEERTAEPPSDPDVAEGWSERLARLLQRAYGEDDLDLATSEQGELVEALTEIGAALRELRQLERDPLALRGALPAELGEAVSLLLARLEEAGPGGGSSESAIDSGDGRGVELLGWLELGLDDAPLIVVTDLNEGRIPQGMTADPFLPEQARSLLGLPDDRRRRARDAFLLQTLLRGRERVLLLAARRSDDDEPLLPSRLLLGSTEKPEVLARRVVDFFVASPAEAAAAPPWPHGDRLRLARPRPGAVAPPRRLRVTALRDYLRSPLRFYYRHVLGLRPVEDQPRELDAASFGSLAHEVLADLARSEAAASTAPATIEAVLLQSLDRRSRRRFGARPPVAVRVQLSRLGERLRRFAGWQAAQSSAGWRLLPELCEASLETEIEVEGVAVRLVGRIDRVEEHPELGYRVVDYKTGDAAARPANVHRPRPSTADDPWRGWRDLQLPLYERLVRPRLARPDAPVALTFCSLDARGQDDPLVVAPWGEEERQEAWEVALEVVRRIVTAEEWPVGDRPPWDDGLGWLCWDDVVLPEARS